MARLVQVPKWVANDGTEFVTEQEAVLHENKQRLERWLYEHPDLTWHDPGPDEVAEVLLKNRSDVALMLGYSKEIHDAARWQVLVRRTTQNKARISLYVDEIGRATIAVGTKVNQAETFEEALEHAL